MGYHQTQGPVKWSYFYLYVILDVFSRYVVGWMISLKETGGLAKQLISETCAKQDIAQDQLTIHSDRGSSMKSKAVAFLLADLGVTKSQSRPYTSNDNCYSEAQFKTLKYRPDFPNRFGSIQDARVHCCSFFDWYNNEHYHSGIAMLTPQTVHQNRAQEIIDKRNAVLLAAAEANPFGSNIDNQHLSNCHRPFGSIRQSLQRLLNKNLSVSHFH